MAALARGSDARYTCVLAIRLETLWEIVLQSGARRTSENARRRSSSSLAQFEYNAGEVIFHDLHKRF